MEGERMITDFQRLDAQLNILRIRRRRSIPRAARADGLSRALLVRYPDEIRLFCWPTDGNAWGVSLHQDGSAQSVQALDTHHTLEIYGETSDVIVSTLPSLELSVEEIVRRIGTVVGGMLAITQENVLAA